MTTPEEARHDLEWAAAVAHKERMPNLARNLLALANQVERLESQRKELRDALQWLVTDFGNTSSEDVTSLKNARATLKATQ